MVAVTGRAQLQELLRAQEIQLLLLDVELDGRGWGEGIEMIHDIRNMTTIPVIIISAQDAETAKIMALNAGADDYVTVGYNPLELRPAVYFFAFRALVFPLAPALLGLIIQPLSVTRIIHPV